MGRRLLFFGSFDNLGDWCFGAASRLVGDKIGDVMTAPMALMAAPYGN
jgi:hypothetical protein